MSEPQPSQEPTRKQIKERTAKIIRRLGYLVFMGGGLLIFIPMIIGVGKGVSNNEIWDPFTGHAVESTERTVDCDEQARQLMVRAGSLDRLSGTWTEAHSAWIVRCQEEHPELYDMLQTTRQQVRKKPPADE
jgi:hypothetical protein